MDNVISPPPPPPPADEANEAPADGLKKPWRKPSVRIINQRLALVENGQIVNPPAGEVVKNLQPGYRPS